MEAHNHMIRYPAVGALIKLTQVVLRTKSKVTVIVCDQRGNSIPTGTARHSRQLHSQQCNVFVSDLRLTQVCICACVCVWGGREWLLFARMHTVRSLLALSPNIGI